MTKLLLTLSLFLVFNFLFSQPNTNWVWAKDGYGNGDGLGIATDGASNIYLSGYFYGGPISFGTHSLTCTASESIFLAKYDSFGQVLWAKSPIGKIPRYDKGAAVATDKNSNLYITGAFESDTLKFGPYTLTNPNPFGGNYNIFLAKYDSSGNVIWAKSVPSLATDTLMYDAANSVAVDINGNVYITGSFSSDSVTFGASILTYTHTSTSSNQNVFIAKYDSSGNILWAKTAIGTGNDVSNSVATDKHGNIYITGYFTSDTLVFNNKVLINASSSGTVQDFFLVKYDGNGNVIWARSAGGNDMDNGSSVAADLSGNIYTTGSLWSDTVRFGNCIATGISSVNGKGNFFLTKWDSAGNCLFTKYGTNIGNNRYAGRSCATDNLNNVFITGYLLGNKGVFDSDTLVGYPGWGDQSYIAKYDSVGNFLNGAILQSGGASTMDIATDISNNAYVGSSLRGGTHFIIGTTTLSIPSSSPAAPFVAKYGSAGFAGVSMPDKVNSFSFYPNPASDLINLKLPKSSSVVNVQIENPMGQIVKQTTFLENINIAELPMGCYFIKVITSSTESYYGKFIKQ